MTCNYRNCDNSLENKRKGSKYCCRACKSMERTYVKRHNKFLEESIRMNENIVKMTKYIKSL